jgi:hypothetical protein
MERSPREIIVEGNFLYELNNDKFQSNRWWLSVSLGHDDNGKLITKEEVDYYASVFAEAFKNKAEIDRLKSQNAELLAACTEALLQIQYLHNKFKPTGSGNNVISRLESAIASTEAEQ